MAHPRLDEVRRRYGYRCGYCDISEIEAGGELTVDHFQPRSAGGDDRDDNLVYCCSRCNLHKSEYSPSPEEVAAGHRVLHPLLDPLDQHYRCEDETGLLESITVTGQFHITLLHLNRPALVAHRLQQRFNVMVVARSEWLEKENVQLRLLLQARERLIESLRRQLGQSQSE